jgi:hypothetical protein
VAASSSSDEDDLKRVTGIGPKIEARLKAAGITTLGQLARTPVNELQAALEGLRGGYDADRITREGWLSEAAALAAATTDAAREAEPAERVRHHFTVEVQLAVANREIVSSKIVHVQTGDEATWGGWDGQRVVAFIEDRSGAHRAGPAAVTEGEALPVLEPAPWPARAATAGEAGLALHSFAMVPDSGPEVTASGPISVALSFDAAAIALPADQPARAKIDVYARQPPAGKSFLVGSEMADISPGEPVQIQVPGDLPPDGYPVVLFAAVQLFAATRAGHKPAGALPRARLTVSAAPAALPTNQAAQPDPARGAT